MTKRIKAVGKRIFPLLVAMVMLISTAAEVVSAESKPTEKSMDQSVTVYVSVSDDGDFVTGNDANKTVMARVPIKVDYFYLSDYGLERFSKYEKNDLGQITGYIKKPTILHCFIKLLEQYYLGGQTLEVGKTKLDGAKEKALNITGDAGSLYMQQFWGHDENLMYYVDHQFPMGGNGIGATADGIFLEDGMEIDLGMFSNWSAHEKGAFANFDPTTRTAEAGKPFDLTLKASATTPSVSGDGANGRMPNESIRISKDNGRTWIKNQKMRTDKDGKITLTLDEAGRYYISAGPLYENYKMDDGSPCVAPPICVVTVRAAGDTPVTGINLDRSKLVLSAGEEAALEASIQPAEAANKNIIWSSSAPSVASVDRKGTIKALKAGKTKITARSEDGNFTAVCNVEVTEDLVEKYTDNQGVAYLLKKGDYTAKVTDCDNNRIPNTGAIIIPGTISGGYTVTSIGDSAFSSCGALKKLELPYSVTNIGAHIFGESAENIEQVTLPNITKIEPSQATGLTLLVLCQKPDETISENIKSAFPKSDEYLKGVRTGGTPKTVVKGTAGNDLKEIIHIADAVYTENGMKLTQGKLALPKPEFTLQGTFDRGTKIVNERLLVAENEPANSLTIRVSGMKDSVKIPLKAAPKPPAPTAPAKVAGLKVKAKNYNSIALSWSTAKNAKGYQIYRSNASKGAYSLVKTTGSRSWTNTNVKTGKRYYYKVRAYRETNGKRLYGAYSAAASNKTKLGVPTKIKGKASKRKASITWKKVNGANGYKVYRATKRSGNYKMVKTIKKASTVKYTNKKLKKGKHYYYKVRAFRKVGGKQVYSGYSKAVRVTIK